MDKLLKCAKAFENLLDIQYRIIIGRKGKTVELVIGFSKLDFHHLMGLGKLKDLRIFYIVDDVADRLALGAALANMQRHDACGCHRRSLLSHKQRKYFLIVHGD